MTTHARRRFADRTKQFTNLWLDEPGMRDRLCFGIHDRLCSDERMQCVWNLTADLPDDRFFRLIAGLVTAMAWGEAGLKIWKICEEADRAVTEAQVALEHLFSLLQRRDRHWDIWQPAEDLAAESDYLRRVQAGLSKQHYAIQVTMAVMVGTRKVASAVRTRFMADAVWLMHEVFGKPHYDAVAAFTAVAFDEDEVDPAAVRAAFRKTANSKWLIRPPK